MYVRSLFARSSLGSYYMAKYCPYLLAATLFVASPRWTVAQSSWDAYKPGRLGAVIEQHDSTVGADCEELSAWTVSGAGFPTLATLTYVGQSRPTDSYRVEVIKRWAAFVGRPASMADVFEREYLFKEGDRELWLPVQREVASFFTAEVQPDGLVKLYVLWLGAHCANSTITWTFIANEFDVPGQK
jgi:hypothetical protein